MTSYYFWAVCPVKGCADNSPDYWYHHNCPKKDRTKIDKDGNLFCASCLNYGKFVNWRFDCGRHNQFLNPDEFRMADVYSSMSSYSKFANDPLFLLDFNDSVTKQLREKLKKN